jgi:predicted amidohydrolase
MSRRVSIAACTFVIRPVAGFDEFADHVRGLLDQAEGADLVLFPELFTLELFTAQPGWEDAPATELPTVDDHTSDYLDLFGREAKERDQYIAAGSHIVREGDRSLNTAHLFEPDGKVHRHAKTHIFPVESDWGADEGDAMDAIELPFARVGFSICYEAEIPECAASLTEQGAEIVLCPSWTATEHGFWRVRHCAQSRCVENQIYMVHACTGGDPGGPLGSAWARSSLLTPCDEPWSPAGVLADSTPNREVVVRGELDIDALYETRSSGAALTYRDRRRRADLYARWPSHLTTDRSPAAG